MPLAAVMRSAQGLSVFRVVDSRAERVAVTVAGFAGEQALLSGDALAVGDQVVYAGLSRLADGDAVELLPERRAAAAMNAAQLLRPRMLGLVVVMLSLLGVAAYLTMARQEDPSFSLSRGDDHRYLSGRGSRVGRAPDPGAAV
ncbi:hypothetical protein ULG90_05830 [Halopseudomonas pachastrellae]|nr:hypothetical protein ULG90_05830 [Halopseudomonas pachastrellae]